MVMLNTNHINTQAAPGSFGGAMCTCQKCKAARAEPVTTVRFDTGLTSVEQDCMDGLVTAFNAFKNLEVQHPTDLQEFVIGIHHLQDMLAVRVCRREYPVGWPTVKEESL